MGACEMRELVYAILRQAIADYRELRNANVTELNKGNCGVYSLAEIENFFYGKWCADLLVALGCDDCRGEYILWKLK